MDPNACLNELHDALSDGDYPLAADLANSLLTWLNKNGFMPGGGKLREESLRNFLDWVKRLALDDEDDG